MDALTALRLQIEWGADEAITDAAHDWLKATAPVPAKAPSPRPAAKTAVLPAIRAEAAAEAQRLADAADSLPALLQVIQDFTLCPLRDTAAHTVLPAGALEAPLILIGDAPSAADDAAGQIGSGDLGAFLDRVLDSIGLSRAGLLLLPLLPWRPPGDRPPSASELAVCLPFLRRILSLASAPHAFVPSPVAIRALFGPKRRIRRGTWTTLDLPGRAAPLNVLPSVSVSQARTNAGMKRELWADLRKLRKELSQYLAKT